jgi:hypothetical protein
LGLCFAFISFISAGAMGFAYAQCALVIQSDESLQEAIDKAPLGATICLANGVWREKIEIRAKTLTLKGTNPEESIVDGLRFENVPCCVNGITVKENSHVILENLAVRNFTASGVAVSDVSRLQLSNVQIFRNENGIGTQGTGRVDVEFSSIVGNRTMGVLAAGSSQVRLQNVRISESGNNGLLALDKADVSIEDSEIAQNHSVGVAVSSLLNNLINFNGGAKVLIQNSKIFKNKQGLYVDYYAELEVRNSEIFENELNGAMVERWGLLSLLNNRIVTNGAFGLFVYSIEGLVKCQGNRVENNGNGLAGGNFNDRQAQQKCS